MRSRRSGNDEAGSLGTNVIRRVVYRLSLRARRKRGEIFRAWLRPRLGDRILDLGGDDGGHIAQILPFREGVVVADISPESLRRASELYGFKTLLLDESGSIPEAEDSFDIVFCSSVIEHATVDKAELEKYATSAAFEEAALERQKVLSDEVRRVGKGYFVQTPNRYFVIESHTWLPAVIVFLPRRAQVRLLRSLSRWWPKKTSPDWHLLTFREMQRLFPDAHVLRERWLGMTKSLIAIKPRL